MRAFLVDGVCIADPAAGSIHASLNHVLDLPHFLATRTCSPMVSPRQGDVVFESSHPPQRCWYSDLIFARIHYFYTAGSGKSLEDIEDVKQDQKTVPDLLESIMRPTDPVKKKSHR